MITFRGLLLGELCEGVAAARVEVEEALGADVVAVVAELLKERSATPV